MDEIESELFRIINNHDVLSLKLANRNKVQPSRDNFKSYREELDASNRFERVLNVLHNFFRNLQIYLRSTILNKMAC